MLVIKVDTVGMQAAERPFDRTANGRRARIGDHGVRAARFGTVEQYAEFRGDDDSVAERTQGLAQQLFVIVRSVDRAIRLGGIEESVAHFHRIGQQFSHFPFVGGSAVGVAHPHAAQPDGRYPQPAQSQCSVFHIFYYLRNGCHLR